MKIRSAEVKTNYTIEYTLEDLWEIVANAATDYTNVKKIFCKYGGDESKLGEVRDLFESFDGMTADELYYISRKLGFDGWSHCGHYDEFKKVRVLHVYRNGDALQ